MGAWLIAVVIFVALYYGTVQRRRRAARQVQRVPIASHVRASAAVRRALQLRGNGGRFERDIVGESSYADSIRWLDKKLGTPGRATLCRATLSMENDNPHDDKAVAVRIDGVLVGYLSRDDARAYRKALADAGFGEAAATCEAMILYFGVKEGRDVYSIRLDL